MFGRATTLMLILSMLFVPVTRGETAARKTVVLTKGQTSATVDGNPVQLRFAPFVTNIKAYDDLPESTRFVILFTDLASLVGGSSKYVAFEKAIEFTVCGKTIKMFTGINEAIVDGQKKPVEMGLVIDNGRTCLSVKVFSELTGGKAGYDETKQQMTAEFPLCLYTAPQYTVANTFAKIERINPDAGKMTIIDTKAKTLEVSLPGDHSSLAPGDLVHVLLVSTGDSWKPAYVKKHDFAYGKGYLTLLFDKKLAVANGTSESLFHDQQVVNGASYMNINDFCKVIGGYMVPGNMTNGELFVFITNRRLSFFIGSDAFTDRTGPEPTTTKLDAKVLLKDGYVLVPTSTIAKILGGSMAASKDGKRIDFALDVMPMLSALKTCSVKIDEIDCASGMIKATDYSRGGIPMAVIDNPKLSCKSLEAGKHYIVICEMVADRDGNSICFATNAIETQNHIFSYKDPLMVSQGKIVEFVEDYKAMVLFDGQKEPLKVSIGNTEMYKAGMAIRGIIQYNTNNLPSMTSTTIVDVADMTPSIFATVTVTKRDSGWVCTDEAGKERRLLLPDVPWDAYSRLENNQRYMMRGFARDESFSVIEFSRTDKPGYWERKIPLTVDSKIGNAFQGFAFWYDGKLWISASLLGLYASRHFPPVLTCVDELCNIIDLGIGSREYRINGVKREFENAPIYIGIGAFLTVNDAARLLPFQVVSSDAESLVIRTFYRNYQSSASDYRFCATVDRIDEAKLSVGATDEFGRQVTILMYSRADLDGLKTGSCYSFIGYNHNWSDILTFKMKSQVDCPCGGGQKPHEVILGRIKSVDCGEKSVEVEDRSGKVVKCLLPATANDCSLLAPGQFVGIEAEKSGDIFKIIYKWHFNKQPAPIVRKITLHDGEKTATVENEKDLFLGYPTSISDGELYLTKYSLSKLFPSSIRITHEDNRVKINLWGHMIFLWLGRKECMIDGKVVPLGNPMKYADSSNSFFIPAFTIFSAIGAQYVAHDEGKSISVTIPYCPIPLEATSTVSQEPFDRIMGVDGVEMFGGSIDMMYKIRLGSLENLPKIGRGSCVKAVYRNFWLFDSMEAFAQSIEPIECPKP